MDKEITLSGLDLINKIRKESLDLPTGSYKILLDEFSLESFSITRLLDVQTTRLRQLLNKIRKIIN